MKSPADSKVVLTLRTLEVFTEDASDIAAGYVDMLDEKLSREDVLKVAEWIHYLSTQD